MKVSARKHSGGCRPPTRRGGCRPPAGGAHGDLASLVKWYIENREEDAEAERKWFREQPSLFLALHYAGLATDHRSKRYSHQRRLTRKALQAMKQALVENAARIEAFGSFAELLSLTTRIADGIHGAGPLLAYDTAARIAENLGESMRPSHVYLHAGTRDGARALGLDTRGAYVPMSALPHELQALKPDQVENFLCILKRELRKVQWTGRKR